MPIEFYCTACEAYLRAPDSKARQAISCPHCSSRIWVPQESVDFDALEYLEELEEAEHEREEYLTPVPVKPVPIVEVDYDEPDEVDLSNILSDTWRIYTRNLRACYTVTVVDTMLTVAAAFVSCLVGGIAAAMVARNPGGAMLAFFSVAGLGMGVMLAMFAVGHIKFYLQLCRGESPDLKKSVDFQGPVGRMMIGGLFFWGTVFLVLPPIFLWPYGRVLMDKRASSVGSLFIALRLTGNHAGVCFALFVVKAGALFASAIIPVVGTILITPYLAVLNTVTYLHMIGELE